MDRASARRVQAVLEAGTRAGVVGVVLGDWAAGTTCRISADGTVLAATDAGLAGAEAFHLPAPDAATMLGLLRGAQGHVTAERRARRARAPARNPVPSHGQQDHRTITPMTPPAVITPARTRPASGQPRRRRPAKIVPRPHSPNPKPHHPQAGLWPRRVTPGRRPGGQL